MPSFNELFAQHAVASIDKEARLAKLLASGTKIRLDLKGGKVHVGDDAQDVHLLGIESPETGAFRWSWSDGFGDVPQALTAHARRLRDAGEKAGVAELTEPNLNTESGPDGRRLAMLAAGLLKCDAFFKVDQGGKLLFILFDAPALHAHDDASPDHCKKVFRKSAKQYELPAHEALKAYLTYKGYDVQRDGDAYRATSPDGQSLKAEVDEFVNEVRFKSGASSAASKDDGGELMLDVPAESAAPAQQPQVGPGGGPMPQVVVYSADDDDEPRWRAMLRDLAGNKKLLIGVAAVLGLLIVGGLVMALLPEGNRGPTVNAATQYPGWGKVELDEGRVTVEMPGKVSKAGKVKLPDYAKSIERQEVSLAAGELFVDFIILNDEMAEDTDKAIEAIRSDITANAKGTDTTATPLDVQGVKGVVVGWTEGNWGYQHRVYVIKDRMYRTVSRVPGYEPPTASDFHGSVAFKSDDALFAGAVKQHITQDQLDLEGLLSGWQRNKMGYGGEMRAPYKMIYKEGLGGPDKRRNHRYASYYKDLGYFGAIYYNYGEDYTHPQGDEGFWKDYSAEKVPEDAIDFEMVTQPHDHGSVCRMIWMMKEKGTTVRYEMRGFLKGGRELYLGTHNVPDSGHAARIADTFFATFTHRESGEPFITLSTGKAKSDVLVALSPDPVDDPKLKWEVRPIAELNVLVESPVELEDITDIRTATTPLDAGDARIHMVAAQAEPSTGDPLNLTILMTERKPGQERDASYRRDWLNEAKQQFTRHIAADAVRARKSDAYEIVLGRADGAILVARLFIKGAMVYDIRAWSSSENLPHVRRFVESIEFPEDRDTPFKIVKDTDGNARVIEGTDPSVTVPTVTQGNDKPATSAGGKFTFGQDKATVDAIAEFKAGPIDRPGGDIVTTQTFFAVVDGLGEFACNYTEFSPSVRVDAAKKFDHFKQVYAGDLAATAKTKGDLNVATPWQRADWTDDKGNAWQVRFYMVGGRRLYQTLSIVGPTAEQAKADAFHESFKVDAPAGRTVVVAPPDGGKPKDVAPDGTVGVVEDSEITAVLNVLRGRATGNKMIAINKIRTKRPKEPHALMSDLLLKEVEASKGAEVLAARALINWAVAEHVPRLRRLRSHRNAGVKRYIGEALTRLTGDADGGQAKDDVKPDTPAPKPDTPAPDPNNQSLFRQDGAGASVNVRDGSAVPSAFAPKADKVMTDEQANAAVGDLASGNAARIQQGLDTLKESKPAKPRSDVAAALLAIYERGTTAQQTSAAEALALWSTEDQVPKLIVMLDTTNTRAQLALFAALGNHPDARSAEALARWLGKAQQATAAASALKRMPAEAEPAVVGVIPTADERTQRTVVRLLGEIGTAKSLPALNKLLSSDAPLVGQLAKQAIDKIKSRQ